MANTTNLNLSKLAGTEKLKNFPSPYNDNMDAIDGAFGSGFGTAGASTVNAEINALGDGLAIIANGNTHAAITSGQFVYVRQHSTLADGLYVASSNISANATLSGSNLDADSSGGLNSLNAKLNQKLTIQAVAGNQSKTLTSTGIGQPTGFMITSYKEMWIISEASSSGDIIATRLTDGSGTGLSVSGRTITFGSDSNRLYYCYLPNGFSLS